MSDTETHVSSTLPLAVDTWPQGCVLTSLCQILGLKVVVLTSSSRSLASGMCTDFKYQIMGLKLVVLTSSSRYMASGMCTDFRCQILGLNVVVLTSSSIYLASVMCTYLNVSDTGTQGSSSDL